MAHVAKCEACSAALEDSTAVRELIDRHVRSLAGGEPSPFLAARIRAQVARESSPAVKIGGRESVAAAASAALALAIFTLVFFHRAPIRNRPAPQTAANFVSAPTAATPSSPDPVIRNIAPAPRLATGPAHALSARPAAPEVLVERGQLRAAFLLSSSIRVGAADGQQLVDFQNKAGRSLEVTPLEVTPLEIQPLQTKPLEIPPLEWASEIPADTQINSVDRP
jgi:hypothetical protein